jgi:immune inhibitor A
VTNTVSGWVTVPNNGSFNGDNATEDTGGAWAFVRDSGNAWWNSQLAAGRTPAQIDAYLSQFDVWDRYDFDNDGNFDEADGGSLGEDAIWSHRWYAFGNQYGSAGPDGNLASGTRIGASYCRGGKYGRLCVEPVPAAC